MNPIVLGYIKLISFTASACNGYQNDGVMIAAASYAIWNNGAVCNKSFRVKCTGATNQGTPHPCRGGSVLVKIVDLCPAGCQATIDLSQEAFSQIADPDAGKIKIEFNQYAHMSKKPCIMRTKHCYIWWLVMFLYLLFCRAWIELPYWGPAGWNKIIISHA